MKKLLMLKGLPGSGKSYFSKELVNDPRWKRVNKDDLRAMMHNSNFSGKMERYIIDARDMLISYWLENDFNVVVDDTNFNPIHEEKLRQIANEFSAEFEVKYFNVDINTCIKRDMKRPDSVGVQVIWDMYNKYVSHPKKCEHANELLPCFICDIDGTLADNSGRNPYSPKVHQDPLIETTAMVVRTLSEKYPVIYMSGRTSCTYDQTCEWLHKYGLMNNSHGLFMRANGDIRKDDRIKRELYETYIEKHYQVLFVLDDRPQVVRMWKELGIFVFNTDQRMYYSEF
jgi:predicted kinase